jgi:GH43 family beta-xylosidase
MATPWSIDGAQTSLSSPTLDWETRGFKVNEAPAVLIRNGRVFITYSASATDANYCVGMLTAAADADLTHAPPAVPVESRRYPGFRRARARWPATAHTLMRMPGPLLFIGTSRARFSTM